MFIKYDEYELIELFESEPTPIFEEEQGIFQYSKEDNAGIQLIFTLLVYESRCQISLNLKKFESRLVEFEFNNVSKFAKSEGRLLIYTEENTEPFTLFSNQESPLVNSLMAKCQKAKGTGTLAPKQSQGTCPLGSPLGSPQNVESNPLL
jgi:hypothetical protein